MSAIDHRAEAESYLETPLGSSFDQTRDYLALAQIHATLALAEQQRIANLIALMANGARMVAEGNGSTDAYLKMHSDVNPIIREGLNLS